MSTLENGQTVGRYRIVQLLGAGAMGEVFLAEDPNIGRRLAIKTVRLTGRPQEIEDRKKRLLREARAAGSLLHPNVVTLFDAGEAEGMLYLAFELVEGTDLATRLEQGPLRLGEVLRFTRQTGDALAYAHAQGIVHRDIKPSNILVDAAGKVKVADFGIAKMAGQSTELTVAGSVLGSPQYLSPEQIRGDELDGRSDIFSLGVVLYELLSGQRPFSGETITTLVYQILHYEPPRVSSLRAVPPRLEQLLERMLAKDREQRIASAAEVARELAAIEAELPETTLSAHAGSPALAATLHLPRQTTGVTVPPAPPAWATSSLPTPVPVPPPPAPPAAPVAPRLASRTATLRASNASRWIGAAAVVAFVAVAAATGWLIYRGLTKERARPEETPAVAEVSTTPEPQGTPETPPVQPTPRPTPRATTPPPAVGVATPRTTPLAAPTPAPLAPRNAPTREPTPAPVRTEPLVEEVEEEAEAEPERPSRQTVAVDRSIGSNLTVVFRVLPSDAHVLVDGRVIGRAEQYTGLKNSGTYTFAEPGPHLVKLRRDGMQEMTIAVEAAATRGTTTIAASLKPLPAADVPTGDLRTVQVREAIAFRLDPPLAMRAAVVLVDGQEVGPVRQYAGRVGRPLDWLRLSPGRYRISVVAPGFARKDFALEVSAGADEVRRRIPLVLQPDGGP